MGKKTSLHIVIFIQQEDKLNLREIFRNMGEKKILGRNWEARLKILEITKKGDNVCFLAELE